MSGGHGPSRSRGSDVTRSRPHSVSSTQCRGASQINGYTRLLCVSPRLLPLMRPTPLGSTDSYETRSTSLDPLVTVFTKDSDLEQTGRFWGRVVEGREGFRSLDSRICPSHVQVFIILNGGQLTRKDPGLWSSTLFPVDDTEEISVLR